MKNEAKTCGLGEHLYHFDSLTQSCSFSENLWVSGIILVPAAAPAAEPAPPPSPPPAAAPAPPAAEAVRC